MGLTRILRRQEEVLRGIERSYPPVVQQDRPKAQERSTDNEPIQNDTIANQSC